MSSDSSLLKTSPYNAGDTYKAKVLDQFVEMNQYNAPQLVLRVKLMAKLIDRFQPEGPADNLDEAFQVMKFIRLSLDPTGDRLQKTMASLSAYGFDVAWPIDCLNPDHAKPFSLKDRMILTRCQIVDGRNGPTDRWWLNEPHSRDKRMSLADLQKFCTENSDSIESSRQNLTQEVPI